MSELKEIIERVLDDVHIETGRIDEYEAVVYALTSAAQAWQAARESEGGEAPIVWINPENIRRTMIAAPGETVEVSAYREEEFTAPLYTHPPKQQNGVPDGNLIVSADWLKRVRRDLDACQKVIWMALRGQCDPAYCEGAQARLREIDEVLTTPQSKGDCTPQPDKWIPCSERLPTEDDGFIWVYSTHTKAVLWRPQTWRDINMWTEREKCLWIPANLRKPTPPEQEGE